MINKGLLRAYFIIHILFFVNVRSLLVNAAVQSCKQRSFIRATLVLRSERYYYVPYIITKLMKTRGRTNLRGPRVTKRLRLDSKRRYAARRRILLRTLIIEPARGILAPP